MAAKRCGPANLPNSESVTMTQNGNFVNPTITINEGANTLTGRSIVNDRSICPQAQEHVPDTENIRTLRAVLNTLGDGFVEAVGDQMFLAIAASQPAQSNGLIQGEAIQVPILEAQGKTGVGKFGWKDQDPNILSFSGDACLNEIGVTNRLKPKDVTSVCKVSTDPEDLLPPGTVINGGAYTVPAALGNKMFHPYGDFLLHDVGTGDGIVQARWVCD